MTNKSYAQFTHTHLGTEYEVRATFSRGAETADFNSPHEADWEQDDIEIVGPDGEDWSGEMETFFSVYVPEVGDPKYVSVYANICEQAHEKMEFE